MNTFLLVNSQMQFLYFIMLINVNMPTIVAINIYEHDKFRAQLI